MSSTTARTVTRLFDSYAAASAAVRDLEVAGFRDADVSLVAAEATAVRNRVAEDDRTGNNAGAGAAIGAALGGGAGLLAGLGAMAIPGLGPVVAAGWLVATLAGAGAGAAAGGLLGALTSAGVEETDANVYAEGVRRGGSLVMVRAQDQTRAAEAEAVLERHGPLDQRRLDADWKAGGWSGRYADEDVARPAPDSTPGNPPGTIASRGLDHAAGTNVSGAYPQQSDPAARGAAAGRSTSDGGASGTQLTPRADDDGRVRPRNPDGAPGNPPGTELSRGVDQAAGTNISGAHPENERKR